MMTTFVLLDETIVLVLCDSVSLQIISKCNQSVFQYYMFLKIKVEMC